MNFLFYVHGYPPSHNAGAERYLHNIAQELIKRKCAVRVLTGAGMLGAFNGMLDGVEVCSDKTKTQELERIEWCDAIVTHLDWTRKAIELAKRYQKPLIYVLHNPLSLSHFKVKPEEAQLLVINSEWLSKQTEWSGPRLVCPPLLRISDFEGVVPPSIGEGSVTLSNLNSNKGGDLFWRLARAMPNVNFLGVKGYGAQEIASARPANVTMMENQPDVREVFKQTRVLLMPSKFESWGMIGLEAMACGIPVIAHGTPGITESMGEAPVYVDRVNIAAWQAEIQRLVNDDQWYAERSYCGRNQAHAVYSRGQTCFEDFYFSLREIVQTRQEIRSSFGRWLQANTAKFGDDRSVEPKPTYSLVTFFSRPWSFKRWLDRFLTLELERADTEILAVIDSQDLAFIEDAGRTLSSACRDFANVRLLITGNHPLYADRDVSARRSRIVDLWNSMIGQIKGQIVIGIEDDTLPIGSDAIKQLLKVKRQEGADFVQATEVGRWSYRLIPHWKATYNNGKLVQIESGTRPEPGEPQTVQIDGCGWYCFVADAKMFREVPPSVSGEIPMGPDVTWGLECRARGFVLVGDWRVHCEHITLTKTLVPTQAGLEHVAWTIRSGGKWNMINRPMKVKETKKLGPLYDQSIGRQKANAENGGILVRAKRTWSGEEGHVFRGVEVYVWPDRHTFLTQQGWIETIDVPQAAKREIPLADDAAEEEILIPELLKGEEGAAADLPEKKAPAPVLKEQSMGAPRVQAAQTVDRSKPIPSGTHDAQNACNKCKRSFESPAALRGHMMGAHKGGK